MEVAKDLFSTIEADSVLSPQLYYGDHLWRFILQLLMINMEELRLKILIRLEFQEVNTFPINMISKLIQNIVG